jgi:hypothetical protein
MEQHKLEVIFFRFWVELILKVTFFLTILWDELLPKNIFIIVLCTKIARLSSTFEGRGCPFFDTFNFWDLVFYE